MLETDDIDDNLGFSLSLNIYLLCWKKVRDSLSSESPREDIIVGNELYIAQKREGLKPGECQTADEWVLVCKNKVILSGKVSI